MFKSYMCALQSHLHSNFMHPRQEKWGVFSPTTFNIQNKLAKVRWGTKGLKLQPVHSPACKSVPWTNYPQLFPLPFFTQKGRQTKTQKQLACLVFLYESAASFSTLSSSSAHKSLALTIYYLSDSMLLFLLSFFLSSLFPYLSKNKALLMTVGSQGPAGARVLESAARWKGGHLLLLFLLFYHR